MKLYWKLWPIARKGAGKKIFKLRRADFRMRKEKLNRKKLESQRESKGGNNQLISEENTDRSFVLMWKLLKKMRIKSSLSTC